MAKQSFKAKRTLLVHAHPDDESLQSAHIMADAIERGAEVFLLTLTRGERGKVKLAELKGLEGNKAAMGAFRAGELRNAMAALGVTNFKFAGTRAYLDTGMRLGNFGRPTTPPRVDELSLHAVSTAVIAEDIVAVMKQFKPDAVITYNAKGGFGHPDHKKAHEATAMAIRAYAKSNRGRRPQFWVFAEKGERFGVAVGGAATAAKKRAALEAHASQVMISRDTYSIAPGIETRFDEPEGLRKASPNILPWFKPAAKALFGLPLGLALGVAGAMLYNVHADNPQHSYIGLYLALTITASVTIGLRFFRNSRGALYLLNLGLTIALWYLSRNHFNGDIFIEDNVAGNRFIWGSLIICAIAVLFPNLRRENWRASGSRSHR
jgi:N-acetyl-1-D-myo-inositol-2-amino-2-deoxy-alpha-D-glucopyranoside deacetylase